MGEHMFSHVNPFYMGKLSQPTMGKLLRQFQAALWFLRGGVRNNFPLNIVPLGFHLYTVKGPLH